MRPILFTILGLVLLLQPETALGQPSLDFDFSFTDSLTLLRLEEVQTDLKLSDDQNAKIKEALAPLREKYVQQAGARGKPSGKKDDGNLDKLRVEIKQQGFRAVEKVVKPEQFRRFEQICVQQLGYKAFADEQVQKALKLTDEQLKKLPMLLAEREKKLKNLRVMRPQDYDRIDAETLQAMIAMLPPAQKQDWEKLVGQELKINRFGMLQRLR